MRLLALAPMLLFAFAACTPAHSAEKAKETEAQKERKTPVEKSDAEWKKQLTPEQYRVLREKGTERAFTGKYNKHKADGVYFCAACGEPLFDSAQKFNSGSGWPSFTAPAEDGAVDELEDRSHGMQRTEVVCASCGGHLGHVFEDGPAPTHLRYCINSASLEFEERTKKED